MLAIGKKYGALPPAEKIEKAEQELAAMRAKNVTILPLIPEDPQPALSLQGEGDAEEVKQ